MILLGPFQFRMFYGSAFVVNSSLGIEVFPLHSESIVLNASIAFGIFLTQRKWTLYYNQYSASAELKLNVQHQAWENLNKLSKRMC